MNKRLMFILCSLIIFPAFASADVTKTGNITSNQVWNSTSTTDSIIISGTVTIGSGVTVTVESGTTVKF